jgi:hypothetical protein
MKWAKLLPPVSKKKKSIQAGEVADTIGFDLFRSSMWLAWGVLLYMDDA